MTHFRRWFMWFAAFLIMSATGATYIFSLYSKDIKSSLGYNQQTFNTLSFFKDLGSNVGILSGLINEVTSPWVIPFIGAIMNLSGYLMIWLAVTDRIARPHLWQMCVYSCIGANSQSFANPSTLLTCVKNFPERRGVVLGLLEGFVSVSGTIITNLYYAFYGDDSISLILFIGLHSAAISMKFLHTIRLMKVVRQLNKLKISYSIHYVGLALAAPAGFLMVVIIVEKRLNFTRAEYGAIAAIVILMLLLPLDVIIKQELQILRHGPDPNPKPVTRAIEKPVVVPATDMQQKQSPSKMARVSSIFKSLYTILQALVSVDILILFLATICGVGGTLTAIDNMGQIGESLGYSSCSIGIFVSLISIWNLCGRATAGFTSEIFLTRYRFPRPLMLTLILLLSCVGHLLIAFPTTASLYFASVILGFCFGAQSLLLFAIISDIFDLKYNSTLYNFGAVASTIGSYLLNVQVAGHVYDKEGLKQRAAAGHVGPVTGYLTCIGSQCYRLSFVIITAVTVFGSFVSLVLAIRTRKFYRNDIYKKFRNAVESAEAEMGAVAAEEGRNPNRNGET